MIILITGCSRGLGLATALRLAENEKHAVYATVRDPAAKNRLLKAASEKKGELRVIDLDVARTDTIKKAVSVIKEESGKIDALVNNAGTAIGGFFEDLTAEEMMEVFNVNLFGVQNVIREALPLMTSGSKIINVSSLSGHFGFKSMSAYCAGKWALEGFSESLRAELSPLGIKVILAIPGAFLTREFAEYEDWVDKVIQRTSAKYYDQIKHTKEKRLRLLKKNAEAPEKFAEFMEKLINKKNPPFRNPVGKIARKMLFIKKILPFSIIERLF